jgi:phosphoglycolate phosphatase
MNRLVVFDCDGTLVDSQHIIIAAAQAACAELNLAPPPEDAIRHVVGLSLELALASLLPGHEAATYRALTAAYKDAFHRLRRDVGMAEPLFEGALAALDGLAERDILLGIATGKGRPGLDAVLAHHGLAARFVTLQTADRHPSKPHPAMLEAAMAEAGAAPVSTWLLGDTSYDMAMATAAGARAVGVAWGYHSAEALRVAGADPVLGHFDQLLPLIDAWR